MEKLTAVSEDTLLQLIQDIPKADAKYAETVETALSKSFIPIEAFGAIKYLLKKIRCRHWYRNLSCYPDKGCSYLLRRSWGG